MCYHCQKKATDCVRTSGRSRGLALHHNISQHSTCLQLALVERHLVDFFLFGGKWTRVALCPHHPQSCMPEPELGPSEHGLGTQDGLGHGMNDMGFSENLVIPNSNQSSFFHWNGMKWPKNIGREGVNPPSLKTCIFAKPNGRPLFQGHHGGTTCGGAAGGGGLSPFQGGYRVVHIKIAVCCGCSSPSSTPFPQKINEDHRCSSIRHTDKWWKCIDNDRYGFVWKYGTPKSTG